MALPRVIPLFPLPAVVLLPHVAAPLHIFEPRYRKMVADVLETHRTIGMTLLRPGWERDYYGRPKIFEQGCAGVIERHEPLPGGRSNIVLSALSRFRVLEEHAGEPYRLATVEPLAEVDDDGGGRGPVRKRVMDAVARLAKAPVVVEGSAELPFEIFVSAIAPCLELTPLELQSLIECDGAVPRGRRLAEILEFRALEQAQPLPSPTRLH